MSKFAAVLSFLSCAFGWLFVNMLSIVVVLISHVRKIIAWPKCYITAVYRSFIHLLLHYLYFWAHHTIVILFYFESSLRVFF